MITCPTALLGHLLATSLTFVLTQASMQSAILLFLHINDANEKKKEVNWPELVTYCGCCTLSTGIFITSIITL
ncbi:hypothetical protein KGM_205481A, partial [Danaus plexippus plexippus]